MIPKEKRDRYSRISVLGVFPGTKKKKTAADAMVRRGGDQGRIEKDGRRPLGLTIKNTRRNC